MDIRQQLLAAFEAEHREHLDAIRSALAGDAEGRPADWNDVFRRAHSLKGAARAVDLPPVEAVAHRLETLFERVSTGAAPLEGRALAATHLALDRIEAFVADTKTGNPAMPADALAALDACLSAPGAEPSAPATVATAPDETKTLEAGVPLPAVTEPVAEPAADTGQAVLRVPAAVVEALTGATYGLANVLPGEAAIAGGLARLVEGSGALRLRAEAMRAAHAGGGGASDGLRDLEAGLSGLTRLAADLTRSQRAFSVALEAAAGRVREEAERLTLVPAETAFGGLARALREMARGEGREVAVTTRGLELPIDRSMLQILKDPVLHALRNALSHGHEPPEARRRAGKPPALGILFEVAARGGRLTIGIHDDGRGPDLAGIARKARERGLLAPDAAIEPDRLLSLVFEPGFSTAAEIDALSGRGIGLAVVADAVRRLQGSARLEARSPRGTSLIMSLPLSAARRPVLLVEAGGETYALPSASAERLIRLDRTAIGAAAGRPVAHVPVAGARETLPVGSLASLLGASAPERPSAAQAILLRGGERRCVLTVERLSDVRTLLVLPAPPLGTDPTLVSGTVILGHDRPALVLDPDGLIARLVDGAIQPLPKSAERYETTDGTMVAKRRSTILVVDDSITTRTLEKSILEAAGYRVVVCVDGQDALEHLRSAGASVDLVLADVEMPRLDGFGLVKAMRSEPAFATLPVILMTSRGASEDVARGLELGADAYLTKQKFDQRELLDTVGQLL